MFIQCQTFRWVATPGPTPQEEAKAEQERQMELKVSLQACTYLDFCIYLYICFDSLLNDVVAGFT